jgi:hypothetical protein
MDQLHRWAMEAVDFPREERDAFITGVAEKYYDDAVKNGLSAAQAEAWRSNINEWVRALVDVIETSGGATGGHA